MAPTAFASGTQTATIGTEHFLANVNVAGTFTMHVDTVNMAAGDVLELRVYQMVLTAGTARPLYFARYTDSEPADDVIKVSDAVGNELTDAQSLRFSLKQTAGTGRAYPWKVLNYG